MSALLLRSSSANHRSHEMRYILEYFVAYAARYVAFCLLAVQIKASARCRARPDATAQPWKTRGLLCVLPTSSLLQQRPVLF
jgi:hypothetical protein